MIRALPLYWKNGRRGSVNEEIQSANKPAPEHRSGGTGGRMGRIGAVLVRIVLSNHFLEKPRRPEVANQTFRLPFGGRTAFGPEPDSFKQQNADDYGQYGRHHQHSKNCGI